MGLLLHLLLLALSVFLSFCQDPILLLLWEK
jgi:hypothetical protein